MKPRLKLYLLALITAIALSFALYGNTLKGQYVYDDGDAFAKRQELRQASHLPQIWNEPFYPNYWQGGGTYRPVVTTTFSLNFIAFGESPFSFHVVNVLLNGLVAFMLFVVAIELFGSLPFAGIAALLFSFLPIHTEVVANIKSRDELLAALFTLVSWWFFLKATKYKRFNYWQLVASGLFFLLALFSKENVVFMPLIFALVSWMRKGFSWRDGFIYAAVFAPFSLVYIALRHHVLHMLFTPDTNSYTVNPVLHAGLWLRTWTAFEIAWMYMFKTFVPFHLSAAYGYNQIALVSNPLHFLSVWLGVAFMAVLAWFLIKRKYRLSPLGVGTLFFISSYLIVSKFVIVWGDLFAERAFYLPSIGICFIAAYWLAKLYQYRRNIAIALLVTVLSAYGVLTIQRNRVWLSADALFHSMVKSAPNSVHAHYSLASYLYNQHDYAGSEAQARQGLAISDRHAFLVQLMGLLSYRKSQYNDAVDYFAKCSAQIPQSYECNYLLAVSLYQAGRYDQSLSYIADRLNRAPNVDLVTLAAANLYRLGDVTNARKIYDGDFKQFDHLYDPGNVLVSY